MEPQWEADSDTFKFKTIYTLEVGVVKLNLIYDTKADEVVSGSVIIQRVDYMEIDVKDVKLEHARRKLMWAAINIGSSVLVKKTDCPVMLAEMEQLVDNLAVIYTMIEESVRQEKEHFRNTFMKGMKDE